MRSWLAGIPLALLVGCGSHRHVLTSAPPTARETLGEWSLCTTTVDREKENAPAFAALGQRRQRAWPWLYDLVIVPGFTPPDGPASGLIHPIAAERLDRAIRYYRGEAAPFLVVTGANVHPAGTPYVEAMLMKRYLLDHGVAESAIFVEPCARHSHTNLRNVGRFMLHEGMRKALIVTSLDQTYYFAKHDLSSFDARCLEDLGYRVGTFTFLPDETVQFEPVLDDYRRGTDPLDP